METSFLIRRVRVRFRLAAGAEDLPPYHGGEATCFLSERQKAGKERRDARLYMRASCALWVVLQCVLHSRRAVKEARKEQYALVSKQLCGNSVERGQLGSASSLTSPRRRGEDLSPKRSRSRTILKMYSSSSRAPMNALVITDASRMGARLGHRLFNGLLVSRSGCTVNMVHQIEIVFG